MICLRLCLVVCFCFFSSRRRHTRLQGDWSSDVCSSDLTPCRAAADCGEDRGIAGTEPAGTGGAFGSEVAAGAVPRSEERRVGKECRGGWSPDYEQKKGRRKSNVGRY